MSSGFVGKLKENRAQIGEGIYLLYFAIMIGVKALGFYEGQMIFNIALVLGIGLFALKMLVTKHSVKEYFLVAAFMLLAGIVYINTGEKGLIVYFCMMLGMKEVSVIKVVRTGAIVSGIIILFKIITGVYGLVDEVYYPQEREGVGLMFRHGLGYPHPNSLHMAVFALTILVIYYASKVTRDKAKLIIYSLMVLAFNVYVFQYSGSRTGLLACVAYLVINLWFYIRKTPGILEKIVCYISFPGACFIAIVLPFIIPENLFDMVNKKIFTTRFSIAKYIWSNNSPAPFGIRLYIPNEWFSTYGLDMSQLYLFLQLGIVTFIVVGALTMWFIHYSLKNSNMAELAVLMGLLVMGVWEPHMYNSSFKNFTFVFMGVAIYETLSGRVSEKVENPQESSIFDRISNGTLIKGICLGAVAGICAMMIFQLATSEPSAFYGSREKNEAGRSLGMEAIYLTRDEVSQLKSAGDIVVGYVDEKTPMYRYDSQIALMEYERRNLSTGVISAIIVFAVSVFVIFKKKFQC